jgi:hypothetical protein
MSVGTERLRRSLLRLGGPGQIAAYHREPAVGLGIEVAGVGRCDFPLTEGRVVELIAQAEPSTFGYRDETRRDASVRDSWEIPAAELRLDDAWSRRFLRGLEEIVEGLGLPSTDVVEPVLHKLLVYGPGQFFAPHRDSQKEPGTAATLVVVLPSPHRGGEVVISHAGRQQTIAAAPDANANYLAFSGFYADCLHETRPVESGYRVALTYALEVEAEALPDFGDGSDVGLADLEQSLRSCFSEDDDEGEGLPWLVYLLDHQYSEQSIDWSRLKNADRTRAAALSEVAEHLGYACFLALADVHEAYEYDESEEDGDDEGDDEDDAALGQASVPPSPALDRNDDCGDDESEIGAHDSDASGFELAGALLEREVTLTAWIDRRGRPCPGTDDAGDLECVVTTVDSHRRAGSETHCEPWTGNEGGTAEMWYQQAALVVVPRDSELYDAIVEPEGEPAEPEGEPARTAPVRRRRR